MLWWKVCLWLQLQVRSDCNRCCIYPDLSYSKSLILSDAYAKMHYEVSEIGFGAEGEYNCKFYKFYLNWHAREQNLPILIVQSGLIDSGFFIKVLKFNGGSTHIWWILHMVLSEGQNRRQKTKQYLRQFATRARILIEESFLSVRVTRVRAKNGSTILRKAKWWVGFGFFFFNVALKKYVIFCLLSMAVF